MPFLLKISLMCYVASRASIRPSCLQWSPSGACMGRGTRYWNETYRLAPHTGGLTLSPIATTWRSGAAPWM